MAISEKEIAPTLGSPSIEYEPLSLLQPVLPETTPASKTRSASAPAIVDDTASLPIAMASTRHAVPSSGTGCSAVIRQRRLGSREQEGAALVDDLEGIHLAQGRDVGRVEPHQRLLARHLVMPPVSIEIAPSALAVYEPA